MVKLISRCLQKLATPVHGVLQLVLNSPLSRSLDVQYLLSKLADSVSAAWRRSFVWRCLQLLLSAFQRLPPWRCSSTSVIDSEAQVPSRNLDIVATNEYPPKLELSDIPTSSSELSSIKWLLETSTDPEIVSAAASLVPDVDWPLHLDVSDMLRQLYDVYTTCLDVQNRIIPSLKEKALACTKALCHLYCHRILQGHDDHDKFIHKKWADFYKFQEMLERTENDNVLVATIKLFVAKYAHWTRRHSPKFRACPDSVPLLDRLSRALPFHFITGKVDEDVEEFAITVISKLLQSPSSPSPQIIANCTLLACVMVGVQFNKKDIVRVDKSSALPQLANSLVQKVCILDRGINQAWKHLDVISRVLAFCLTGPAFLTAMWMLGMCRKIYSRADSTKQHDLDSVLRRFRFTIDAGRFLSLAARADPYADPANPAWLWQHQISWLSDSHLPEDFDWLVDYLGDVFPSDHDTAGDIFVLLSSMRVSYSPAKQHLFIEALTACMGSNMPPRLRHAALCAAHSSREVLASIDVNDADMVLTNLSPAILTAVCPQPGATPTDDSPDCFSHYERDLCYLELIFALARNSYYRPHLHCQMDRAIRMIALYCDSGSDHAFYLVGFFLRMTSEEVSATSLISITKQQWWDMMKKAWYWACRTIDDTRCVEFLPDLVDETKKYKGVASELDVKQLSRDVDYVTRHMESRGQKGVEELRSRTRGMLDELSRQ
ncbi:hypothetical protein BDR04DRAFT_89563 [Suillus decipiens]|nr:hypothetical protein BDR04DRAFT_89563 [Suillus decipiens]